MVLFTVALLEILSVGVDVDVDVGVGVKVHIGSISTFIIIFNYAF